MATKRTGTNGGSRLDEALATLVQTQAAFVSEMADINRRHAENERLCNQYRRDADKRFARIETKMAEIIRILNYHSRQLDRLPEAVRDRIGFKS